jgi:hypothetical protein
MVGTNKLIDVAVIDEAQMIFDLSRGWAWTQAIVAVPAKEVIIICSAYAVTAIENLLGLCGETSEVIRFQRKQHVQLLPGPVPLANLKKGDAVVAFSRRDVLTIRDRIAAANGLTVSVIYGALPPEVRRREAERFATGESQVLVATDAIGMGLNLPIRRVLFSTMNKFDGQGDRSLTESEVHQIAGRAGRYGMHEEGFTSVLAEAEPSAMKMLRELLPRQPRAPRQFKAPVAPNGWHIDTISSAKCSASSWASFSSTTRTSRWPSWSRCSNSPTSSTAPRAASPCASASPTRRPRSTPAPNPRSKPSSVGPRPMPPSVARVSPGSSTAWMSTAASIAWSRPCAHARCGCGSTCASPASTATSTRW